MNPHTSFGDTYPNFATGLAVDCLWDTIDATRELGAALVDPNIPAASTCPHELADDPHETNEVRTAAKAK